MHDTGKVAALHHEMVKSREIRYYSARAFGPTRRLRGTLPVGLSKGHYYKYRVVL